MTVATRGSMTLAIDMIESYRDQDTRAVAERRPVRKLPHDIQRRAQRKLMMLNNAVVDLNDLRVPPGNRLETLSGDRDGQHSIRINDAVAHLLRVERGARLAR